jgi:hypothetical protein
LPQEPRSWSLPGPLLNGFGGRTNTLGDIYAIDAIGNPWHSRCSAGLLIADEVVDVFSPVRFYWVRRARWLKIQQDREAEWRNQAANEQRIQDEVNGNGQIEVAPVPDF